MNQHIGKSRNDFSKGPKHTIVGLVLLVAATALGTLGCGGRTTRMVRSIKRPRIRVRKVRLVRANPKRVVVRLHMVVHNPYNTPLPPSELSYRFWLAGVHLTAGRLQIPHSIPPRSKAPITTTLRFGPLDAAKVAAKMAIGYRRWKIRATLKVRTPGGGGGAEGKERR